LAEPKLKKELTNVLKEFRVTSDNQSLGIYGKKNFTDADCALNPRPNDCRTQDEQAVFNIIDGLSLNRIHLVIGGVMTTEVMAIPATIENVSFDGGNNVASLWTTQATGIKANLVGQYLQDGVISIQEADKYGIKDIKVETDSSCDRFLNFSLSLTKTIPNDAHLHFVVTKTAKDKVPIKGTQFDFQVNYTPPPPVDAAPTPAAPAVPTATNPSGAAAPSAASVLGRIPR